MSGVSYPGFGQNLPVADRGLKSPDSRRTHESGMGHLLPMAERASATFAAPAGRPATRARS